jgi:HK97 family phage portal protein
MGSFTWRQSMLGVALMWGNAYAEIERDRRGIPLALWPIHPDRVAVKRNTAQRLEYEVWNPSGRVILPAEDMFHVRGFGDGPIGYNVVEYAAQSIGWAQATEIFGATSFAKGMNPTGVIESEQTMSPAGLEELRKSVKQLYYGAEGDRTLILDAKMKFQKIQTTLEESQFIETRQHQVEEICRWFGVPPHKVMHLLRATFGNIEHQSIEVVVDSVTPWVKIFEDEANYKLFGPLNRSGLFTKMNLRGLLRGDNAARASYYKTLWSIGVLTINDILGFEDMSPVAGDFGDQRYVQNVFVPIEKAGEQPPGAASTQGTEDNQPEPGTGAEPRAHLNGNGKTAAFNTRG